MTNPWHSDMSMVHAKGSKAPSDPKAASAHPMPMKTGGFPGVPGKTGPNRNPWKVAKKVKNHTTDEGL